MQNKKSQGLSFNVIIIAAISLIVLVVLVAIFTGYTGNWARSFAGTCQDQGGICSDLGGSPGECNDPDFSRKIFAKGCTNYVRKWDPAEKEYKYVPSEDKNKAGQCCLPS